MKRNNKKGFTIVELVIVIAVIAILSAVLIPTFGTIIADANETARDQEAKNLYTSYIAEAAKTGDVSGDGVVVVDGYYYQVTDGQIILEGNQTTTALTGTVLACKTYTDNSGVCKFCAQHKFSDTTSPADGKCDATDCALGHHNHK